MHPLFLVSAGVTLFAVVLCLALPDRELKGAAPAERLPTESSADAAVEMEAQAATMI